jgi:methanogenic corrinoid protein MtbC1
MISAVVYRSRAVRSLAPPDLHALTEVAQSRNAREAVTGLMLYDGGSFFQWLEGPAEGVGRVMNSIRRDPRHTDIEVLNDAPVPSRRFSDWSMKLATPGSMAIAASPDVLKAPAAIVEDLRQRPDAAPVLLVKLVEMSAAEAADLSMDEAIAQLPLQERVATLLKSVVLSTVIPRVADGCEKLPQQPVPRQALARQAHPRTAELASLLIAADQNAAVELISELLGARHGTASLHGTLFEPAARRLGDLWGEDECSEFDVTLGLCRLQSALRLLADDRAHRLARGAERPLVLIAPVPGELHRIGAAMDNSVLQGAGWSPQCEYPADDAALDALLAGTWFDVLDLSLSAAFRREHLLPQIAQTIAHARLASRNPALVVVVGGRVFAEESNAGAQVGADMASTTSVNVDRAIMRMLTTSRTPTLTSLGLRDVAATAC